MLLITVSQANNSQTTIYVSMGCIDEQGGKPMILVNFTHVQTYNGSLWLFALTVYYYNIILYLNIKLNKIILNYQIILNKKDFNKLNNNKIINNLNLLLLKYNQIFWDFFLNLIN